MTTMDPVESPALRDDPHQPREQASARGPWREAVRPFWPLIWGLPVIVGAAQYSVAIAAVVYVLLFVLVVSTRPAYGLALVIFGAPFQQDLGAGLPVRISLGELNLLLLGVMLAVRGDWPAPRFRWNPLMRGVLLYLLACLIATAVTYRGSVAVVSFFQMLLYLIVAPAVVMASFRKPAEVERGFRALLLIGLVVSLAILVEGTSYVFGLHKNGAGATVGLSLVVATHLLCQQWASVRERRQLLVLCLLLGAGLVSSLSRGAWLGTAAGILVVLWSHRQLWVAWRVLPYAMPVVLLAFFLLPEDDRNYAFGFEAERWNIKTRLDSLRYAENQFWSSPLVGVGVGLRKQYDATNLVLSTLAETGVIGLLGFAAMVAGLLRMLLRVRLSPRLPPAWMALAGVGAALLISRLVHGMVDHFWSRGPLLLGWVGAGLLAAAWHQDRDLRRRASGKRDV